MSKKGPKFRFSGFTDDWQEKKLGDVAEIITSNLQSSKIKNTGSSPVFDATGKIGYSDYAASDEDFFTIIKDGSNVGRTKFMLKNYNFTSTLNGIKGKKNISKTYFVYLLVSNFNFTKYIVGSGIPHIYFSQYKEELISLPTLPEQEKIGDFFALLDEQIAVQERKLENLKLKKKALLTKMFPKPGQTRPELRFAGFTDDWQEKKLGEVSIIKGRLGWKSLKQEEYTDDGPSMIAGKHINNGAIQWDRVDHIPNWRYEESPEIMLENGDIIFSKDGTLGNPALIKNLDRYAHYQLYNDVSACE